MTGCEKLLQVIREGKRLVVFLHDNPDPDSIAAGWLLAEIGRHAGVRTRIVYGGRLGRAENRTLVRLLKVPVRRLTKPMRLFRTDRLAMVDTQPGTGNNSFPHERHRCHVVIDHHPRRKGFEAGFVDIRPEVGSCATLLLDYHRECGLEPGPDLATACAYAILSETQDLGRETTPADRRAFQQVFPQVRLGTLGRIRHPTHGRDYYRTIARAMRHVMVSKNTCVCHIGTVDEPEAVAELADFLIPMQRVTWCLVTGFHGGDMILSIRSTQPRARAERVMRRVLDRLGRGGGHGMIAGGLLPCQTLERYTELAPRITERFLKRLSRRVPENLKPLLEEDQPDA